jgi:signal transduction histidine kinase/ligand-binding sensor domain-containing protein
MAGRWFPLLSLLLACLAPALAPAHGATPIALHHMSWTAREGAPQMVITMTQTREGWLWLGGNNGLFRFDGVSFERYADPERPLPAAGIAIINAFDDGSLWIGYRYGGVSVLNQGRLRNYNERDGLPASTAVWGLERDGSGRMWAATAHGMFYLDRERWAAAGPDFSLPSTSYKTLMRDRYGALWAQGDEGVYKLPPGQRSFIKAAPDSGTGVLFDVPDGSVWSWNAPRSRLRRLTPAANGAAPRNWAIGGDVSSLLFDSAGDLWVGRLTGVEHHTVGGVQQSGPEQGLSGRWVTAMFEDREGNIWTSTTSGIDRFRPQRIAAVPIPAVTDINPLAAAVDGGVWVGRFHFSHLENPSLAVRSLWPGSAGAWGMDPVCVYVDPAGVLWLANYGELWRKSGQQLRRVALPAPVQGHTVASMALDAGGALWVAFMQQGLYRLDPHGEWRDMEAELGQLNEKARVVASSARQGLWLGYPRNRVLQFQDGRWRRYGSADGLRVGMVGTLHLKGAHVWVGGENGVALRQGNRFVAVDGIDGLRFEGVSGIVELDNGDLWLNAATGLFRIPAAEIAQLLAMPGYRVRYEHLNSLDGLSGSAPVRYPVPSLIEAANGHLWISTTAGVFRLDPSIPQKPGPAAPVLIRALGPPGQARQALGGMRLAADTTALQIDYTAVALAMPERVAFRYRLDGVDAGWQQVGARRAAYYNNLGPGAYHFSVQATNYNGDWSTQASTLDFSIAPTIPQSWWFKTGCAMLLLAACWLLYRRRMHNHALQVSGRLEERIRERERIARELHDTLLQSVQGMILHVHAAAMRLPQPEPARLMIEEALQQADDVLLEGRERVRDLRAGEVDEQDLAEALSVAGCRLQSPDAASLQVHVSGTVRKLHPLIYEEVMAIAGEAIANAYRHASANKTEVLLHYSARELRLNIRDDGPGIPADVIAAGGRRGHWGICGMYERAERIKASLILRSAPGAGTEWCLTLPGALAYQAPPRRFWKS